MVVFYSLNWSKFFYYILQLLFQIWCISTKKRKEIPPCVLFGSREIIKRLLKLVHIIAINQSILFILVHELDMGSVESNRAGLVLLLFYVHLLVVLLKGLALLATLLI